MKAVEEQPKLAWRVTVNDISCIVFATTAPKARWRCVHSYWEAGYGRKGQWPNAKAMRMPSFDSSPLKNNHRQQAWTEEYVANYP